MDADVGDIGGPLEDLFELLSTASVPEPSEVLIGPQDRLLDGFPAVVKAGLGGPVAGGLVIAGFLVDAFFKGIELVKGGLDAAVGAKHVEEDATVGALLEKVAQLRQQEKYDGVDCHQGVLEIVPGVSYFRPADEEGLVDAAAGSEIHHLFYPRQERSHLLLVADPDLSETAECQQATRVRKKKSRDGYGHTYCD